jgi:hypothetical protein
MRANILASLAAVIWCSTAVVGFGCGGYGALPEAVLSDDPQLVEATIAELRAEGVRGFNRLLRYRDRLAEAKVAEENAADHLAKLTKLDEAIDRVGGAKYCRASRLFWHTDLEQAIAAAKVSGKPILALRMMGNLTDEFSCANSRFFRTTLYANEEIAKTLRENFILTWKSVRPVPKVTIDFGDGRKLERTLTGNSIHYVLTPDGEVVDALPGLYGPGAFLKQLQQAAEAARELAAQPADERRAQVVSLHRAGLRNIAARWQADLERMQTPRPVSGNATNQIASNPPPTAIAAAAIARPKGRIEMPLLEAMTRRFAELDRTTSDEVWGQIARLHSEEAQLDKASRALVTGQAPTAAQAGQLAITKRVVEDPLVRLVRNLQHSIALDTVRNEYVLHRKLHVWLAEQPELARNIDALNERVYAELFLTPSSDPWLGLAPPDVYTALPNNGVVAGK